MGKVFMGQTALRITLRTFCDLEGIENAVIKYRKPNNKTGDFSAAVGDAAQGSIFYECIEGDIDISGWWVFWAFITFADGRTAAGRRRRFMCGRRGSEK